MTTPAEVEAVARARTHDYRIRSWGHDYTFYPSSGGLKASMSGWGRGISVGDYLILDNDTPNGSRYQVDHIRYYADPPDMWSASVSFAPRPIICPTCNEPQTEWREDVDPQYMVRRRRYGCGHEETKPA